MSHDHDDRPQLTAAQAEAALSPPAGRNGGDLVVETLQGLGATTVFGLPGQHALGMFDALRRSSLSYVGLRVENNAGFAADAYGRITGEVAPLLLSTGPGALTSLAALQEAAAASAPVLAISSQVPTPGLGGGRHGYLHELRDQQASFRDIVKSVHTARTASQIPSAIAAAWESALTAPHGPVWVEIPQDVLLAETVLPVVSALDATPRELYPRPELTLAAAQLLSHAERPVIVAGGGVVRSDASGKLRALAEKLDAPVVTTFGGKGAFPGSTRSRSGPGWRTGTPRTSWSPRTYCWSSARGWVNSPRTTTRSPRAAGSSRSRPTPGSWSPTTPRSVSTPTPARHSQTSWTRWSRARTPRRPSASARCWSGSTSGSRGRTSRWSSRCWPRSARRCPTRHPASGT